MIYKIWLRKYAWILIHIYIILIKCQKGYAFTKSDTTHNINNYTLGIIEGDEGIYYGSDSIFKIEGDILDQDILYPT